MDEPNKIGRPSGYTQDLADRICKELAMGKSMRTVAKLEGMPSMVTIFSWLRLFPDFLKQYTRAKEESADALIEEMLAIADDGENDTYVDEKGRTRTDWDVVGRSKLRVDTRKWIASKLKPKKYGDKLDLTSDGKALPTPILGGNTTNALSTNNSNPEDTQAE